MSIQRREEDQQAIRMFVRRFGVDVEALNGLLASATEPTEPTEPTETTEGYPRAEREKVARQVLWHFGDTDSGYPAGSFVSGLLMLWGRADMWNEGRLASVFPLYATALQLYNSSGKDALLEWGLKP